MKKKETQELLNKSYPLYWDAPKWVKHAGAYGMNAKPGAWLGKEVDNGQG